VDELLEGEVLLELEDDGFFVLEPELVLPAAPLVCAETKAALASSATVAAKRGRRPLEMVD